MDITLLLDNVFITLMFNTSYVKPYNTNDYHAYTNDLYQGHRFSEVYNSDYGNEGGAYSGPDRVRDTHIYPLDGHSQCHERQDIEHED